MFLSVPALRAFPFSKLFWPSSLNQSFHDPYAPPRTNRTRRVPHPVLIGHAASLTSQWPPVVDETKVRLRMLRSTYEASQVPQRPLQRPLRRNVGWS